MRFFIFLGLLGLPACDAGENKANPDGVMIGNDEGTIIPSKEPASPPPEATVPSIAMPGFAPQYPGSRIKTVNSSPTGQDLHEVTLETRDDASSIMAFYRDRFSAAGLKETSDFESGSTGVLSAAAKGKTASIAITSHGAMNEVIVTYSGG